MTTHIDTLTEWWENAEEGVVEKGDTVIHRSDGETTVYVAVERARRQHPNARILHRAPKPKPAWHDAVAVIAHTYEQDGDDIRRAFVPQRDGDTDEWRDGNGIVYCRDDLASVTPLIEAKVTDEMVQRFVDADRSGDEDISYLLAVALGIDPE